MNFSFIEQLQTRYAQGLPGRPFQEKMASSFARSRSMEAPPNARKAAVLALLVPENNHWAVVLTQRTTLNPNDRHSGQISFPGGQLEKEETYAACALRETEEEIGVPRHQINMLGALTDLYIPVSNYQVFPFLGWLDAPQPYQKQPTEVVEVLEVPLLHLLDAENLRFKDLQVGEHHLPNTPYFDYSGNIIWGATAMMLNELLELMRT
jgi:8-oxo-dGTP pyrophosphatase MutT (NUDIX family)